MKVLTLLLVIVISLSLFLACQQQQSPELVAKACYESLQRNRVDDFAGCMHVDALNRFKDLMIPLIDKAANKPERERIILSLFEGVESIDALKKLNPQAFFAAFFKKTFMMNPKTQKTLTSQKLEFLGHIKEGDVAHVVYRSSFPSEGTTLTQLSVASLKRQNNDWRLLLSGDIESMVKLIENVE